MQGNAEMLGELLRSRDGAPYPAYREIRGRYAFAEGVLEILHVQPDPFAPASRLRVIVPARLAGLERDGTGGVAMSGLTAAGRTSNLGRRTSSPAAWREWLAEHPDTGSVVRIDPAGQQILRRTALSAIDGRLELLLSADLPAKGRRIEGRRAAAALATGIPQLVREALGQRDLRSLRAGASLRIDRRPRGASSPVGRRGLDRLRSGRLASRQTLGRGRFTDGRGIGSLPFPARYGGRGRCFRMRGESAAPPSGRASSFCAAGHFTASRPSCGRSPPPSIRTFRVMGARKWPSTRRPWRFGPRTAARSRTST